MFSPAVCGYEYQKFDRSKVRSWAMALGDSFSRPDVVEFSKRLARELCDSEIPQLTADSFWQLARWCKTGGAYTKGMGFAQNISVAVFGRIIQRR